MGKGDGTSICVVSVFSLPTDYIPKILRVCHKILSDFARFDDLLQLLCVFVIGGQGAGGSWAGRAEGRGQPEAAGWRRQRERLSTGTSDITIG